MAALWRHIQNMVSGCAGVELQYLMVLRYNRTTPTDHKTQATRVQEWFHGVTKCRVPQAPRAEAPAAQAPRAEAPQPKPRDARAPKPRASKPRAQKPRAPKPCAPKPRVSIGDVYCKAAYTVVHHVLILAALGTFNNNLKGLSTRECIWN